MHSSPLDRITNELNVTRHQINNLHPNLLCKTKTDLSVKPHRPLKALLT